MTNRTIILFFLVLLGAITICYGETDYKGLKPASSTRTDVEKTLGQASREISATLSQYKSDKEGESIFVQYRRDSNVIERIEVLYSNPIERSLAISTLNLSPTSVASQVNAKGRLEEYFSPNYVVLTYSTAEASLVSRVGFYSQALFEKQLPEGEQKGLGPDREGWGFNQETATILTYYSSATVAACRADCEKDSKCMAFSWIKPGFYNPGDSAMCYLMSSWNKLIEQPCCISAVKNKK